MNAFYALLDSYDQSNLMTLAFLAAFGSYLSGTLVDRIMKKRGFGPSGNAILILFGVGAGLSYAYTRMGALAPSESHQIIAIATIGATLTLLVSGGLKRLLANTA